MTQPKIEIDYPMMNFDMAVKQSREEPGFSLEDMAIVIKSRLDKAELESLIKNIKGDI